LDLGDVRRLLSLGARDEVKLDALALGERAEAARADGREGDEDLLAGVRGDEADALRVVQPLHRALHAPFRGPGLRRGPRGPRAARPVSRTAPTAVPLPATAPPRPAP